MTPQDSAKLAGELAQLRRETGRLRVAAVLFAAVDVGLLVTWILRADEAAFFLK